MTNRPSDPSSNSLLHNYLRAILRAPVYQVARESPLDFARLLSHRLGLELWLKREDLQPIFSFKLRGAYCKLSQLSEAQRSRGVVASSAGNHAQGVALAAERLGVEATIVMPVVTPLIKVSAVRRLGGRVELHGDSYDEAFVRARTLAEEKGMAFIPPYDDPAIIAGQGTVAVEIMRQAVRPPDAIFVPVGGGGLIAGIAAYTRQLYPEVKIIGVEPEDAACLQAAMAAGKRVRLDQVGLFADGASVRQVGVHPWEVARQCVDGVVTVSVDEMCAAIRDIFEETRSIAEPAGALAVAGLKKHHQHHHQLRRAVAVLSGANMNFDRLRYVADRALIGEKQEALYSVVIREQAGSFLRFCRLLKAHVITEFNYRYADSTNAHIFVGIALRHGSEEADAIASKMTADGYSVVDISDNELAKTHVRYMVGGRAALRDERVLRFEFPERPRALLNFLERLGNQWNISLFHYRNHGSSHGRVLAGFQVSENEEKAFFGALEVLGYAFTDETNNPAYRFFLQ